MRQTFFILTVSTLLTSCASIMNQSHTHITVYTTEPSEIILNRDTILTIDNQATLKVERKNEVINIIATSDSLTKEIEVEPKNSIMFYSNIFFNYGFGMLLDRKNPKRYAYPQRIFINSEDTDNRFYRYGHPNMKGDFHMHISMPHINTFMSQPENEESKINTGFWGLTIGLDYYHQKNQFLNFSISGVSDFFVPVPAAIDIIGEYELLSSRYVSFSNNHRLARFTLGYGLSYARNTWDLRFYDRFDPPPPTREPIKRSHIAFGFVFPTYFQFGERFHLGAIYRPTLMRPGLTNKFKYEHLISIDFAWKIRLKK